jgi:hypothetical protein
MVVQSKFDIEQDCDSPQQACEIFSPWSTNQSFGQRRRLEACQTNSSHCLAKST